MQRNTSGLTIRLLGRFEVAINGNPIPKMDAKDASLLALLVLAHGRAVNRAELAQTLWPFPDYARDRATGYLRKSLWQLRKALGAEAIRVQSAHPGALAMDLTGAAVDLITFDRAVARTDIDSLQEAIACYGGPFLPGCIEPWALQEREKRKQAYLRALHQLSAHASAGGDHEDAIRYLHQARSVDLYWEPTRQALMEALARSGHLNEALQEYQDLCKLLQRERNGEPGQEITALYDRLRPRSGRSHAAPPPTVTAPPPPPRLPQPLTTLIGREAEIGEVQARLRLTRLMTLLGAGGVGKTRLSLAVAEQVAPEYAEGVRFVELAALHDPAHIARAIARALSVREEPQCPLIHTLCDYLAQRALLLVLDNCEHLLDACADLVYTLLLACPDLRILTTSRQPLSIVGETTWRVPSLSAPKSGEFATDAANLVAFMARYAAVRLFVERATAQAPFQLTPENAPQVAQICHLLDGIPLAIEMAAARIRMLSPAKILEGLSDRFNLLTGGSRTVLARHQTLWALIDWSHTLLAAPEQQLLRRLSVFRGGFTLEAVEAVASTSLLLDLLTGLADKSLISIENDLAGEPRYALPETVRQFAYYQLANEKEDLAVGQRHRDYFLALAENAEPELRNAHQPVWLDRLEKEHDNLRAALDYAGDRDIERSLRLATALWHFWAIRGYIAEGRERLTAALGVAPASSPYRARALIAAGVLTDYDGMPEQAVPLLTEGLDLARQSGDRWLIGHALIMLGWVHRLVDPACATRHLREAEALAREVGDRWLLIEALSTGGFCAFYHGDVPRARNLFEEGLPLCRELGDPWLMGEMVCHLGLVYRLDHEYEIAEMLFEESLQWSRELGDRRGTCSTLCYLGDVLLHRGDNQAACDYFLAGLEQSSGLNYVRGIASALEGLAFLAQTEGRGMRAARLMGAADALRASHRAPRVRLWQPDYDHLKAQVQQMLGDPRFSAVLGQGQRMSQQQAIRYGGDIIID